MTTQDQINAFGQLANELKKYLSRKRFTENEEDRKAESAIRQAYELVADHGELCSLWQAASNGRNGKFGEFIRLDKAADINQAYRDRFDPDSTGQSDTPTAPRLPLFPAMMWLVDAKKMRKMTNLRKADNSEAHLIRIYPGINTPVDVEGKPKGDPYFTFVFAAEDIHGQLIDNGNMTQASRDELIDDKGKIVEGASALEEIGVCNPCEKLKSTVSQRPA